MFLFESRNAIKGRGIRELGMPREILSCLIRVISPKRTQALQHKYRYCKLYIGLETWLVFIMPAAATGLFATTLAPTFGALLSNIM
jgi:hypothetical protein